MKILVTGGAGFIGSNLTDVLLADGHFVKVLDNFKTGHKEFVADALSHSRFELLTGDLLDYKAVLEATVSVDAVIHLAANADVRFGWQHPRLDFEQNVVATQNVLEAMRANSVRRLLFSSTGSVYGDASTVPTPENTLFPRQTSLYGASKCAAEGIISAYSEAGFVSASVFRFVSILGPRYTHGHIIDFIRQLRSHPSTLEVLGDGNQKKSYLHVRDCINAIRLRLPTDPGFEVLNLGTKEVCSVRDSVRIVTSELGLTPQISYLGGERGWVGDSPLILLDTQRICSLGWAPAFSIREAMLSTINWIVSNEWVL